MTKDLVLGFGALSAAMAFGGTVSLLTAAIKGLGLALSFTGVGGIGGAAGIAAVGSAFLPVAAGITAIGVALYGIKWLYDFAGSDNKTKFLSTGNDWYQNKAVLPVVAVKDSVKGDGNILGFNNSRMSIDSVRSNNGAKTTQINNKIVMPNGQVLADVVTHHQVKAASRPQSGISSYDTTMSAPHPSLNYGR